MTLLRSFSLHVFFKQTNDPIESAAYNSSLLEPASNGSVAKALQRTSLDFIVLYRTFDSLDLKIGHLIGWI